MSLAEAGATSLLVNSSAFLGDGVWTSNPTPDDKTTPTSSDFESIRTFKTEDFFPSQT